MNLDDSLRQEVVGELSRLVEISSDLRAAMLSRDPDRIMEVAARSENVGMSSALLAAPPDVMQDEEIGTLARQLRRLQESNRLLASTFQKLYRQILRPVHADGNDDPGLYGRSGLLQTPAASPLLIRQIG